MNKHNACKDIQDKLALYHYGELGPDEAAAVRAHLASCDACSAELDGLVSTLGLVTDGAKRDGASYAPGSAAVNRAHAAVMEKIARKKRIWPMLVPVFAAAAAAVLIAVTGVFVDSPFDGTKGPTVLTQAPVQAPAQEPGQATTQGPGQEPGQPPVQAIGQADEVVTAQADWELLENMDLLANLDVLEDLDLLEDIETTL